MYVSAVLRQPWALTLWTFLQLQERDRVRSMVRRIERADDAMMAAWAFHEPEKVASERHEAMSAAATPTGEADTSAFTADVEAFLAELDGGKVMED